MLFKTLFSREKIKDTLLLSGGIIFIVFGIFYGLNAHLHSLYEKQISVVVLDRNGAELEVRPNNRTYYARAIQSVPSEFKSLLLKKEDRYFYLHPGVNPLSIARDMLRFLTRGRLEGSSTISQQLVKNLLINENQRTLSNKFVETIYTLGLELFTSKERILTMYANTAYFGKQAQGVVEASNYYFGVAPEVLTKEQSLALLATLNNPSGRFPGSSRNTNFLPVLARSLGTRIETSTNALTLSAGYKTRKSDESFELQGLDVPCATSCRLTLDKELTERLRAMLARHLDSKAFESVKNGAIVVIKTSPTGNQNELLAIVGSPRPQSSEAGLQINLAIEPRPIGSTIKPFIYTEAFEKGFRPYTLVDDREYRYTIGTGYSFYPKNYDGQYRGLVTLHEALSNSLNVPTVKVLEAVGVPVFNELLEKELAFRPRQPLEDYELGIALGGLEMDLLTLTNYFSLFPNNGVLKPLLIGTENTETSLATLPMAENSDTPKTIFEASATQLTNTILSDRQTGVNQFGIKSNLNLTQQNYGVKTGTSYDFHDSWTVGFTPDFVIGVWLGNSDNTPIREISGQAGAGTIWHDAMEILLNSPYNEKTPLLTPEVQTFSHSGNLEYGLAHDDYEVARDALLSNKLILEPHEGDIFLFEKNMAIPLRSREAVTWQINDRTLHGKETSWQPLASGSYTIQAKTAKGTEEKVTITIKNEE